MMRNAFALCAALMVSACAHGDIAINSTHSTASATSVTSGSARLQVNASGGVAAALAAGLIIAEWFSGPAVPEMDPSRSVSVQDCSKPIAGTGNLRCK